MHSKPLQYKLLILTHNRRILVERCLASLTSTLARTNATVCVLDNHSTDGTAEWLNHWQTIHPYSAQIELVLSSENLGVAGGRHYLLAQERQQPHDVVVFLDSDAWIVSDSWLNHLTDWLQPDDVGLVGPGGHNVVWNGLPRQEFIAIPYGECDVVSGYCQAFKGVLLTQGIDVDPAYGLFWHEDGDMCMQIRQLGYRILSTGEVGVAHIPGISGGSYANYENTMERFRQKWYGKQLTKMEGNIR